ncbi:hypothetical protein [Fictibacillus sp. JL2B1089]|uniref:hypothetical protein n=1 Tax=Fictibacillus sp. JL2B1089 TaxID=3399565 RepID=UPI003A8BA62C
MNKRMVLSFAFILLMVSSAAVYKFVLEKDRYSSVSIVPEHRKDLPLYEGLEFQDHHYVIKGNHWYEIYKFYRDTLPHHGWKPVHKRASIEEWGGFMLQFKKNDKELILMVVGILIQTKQKLLLTLILPTIKHNK